MISLFVVSFCFLLVHTIIGFLVHRQYIKTLDLVFVEKTSFFKNGYTCHVICFQLTLNNHLTKILEYEGNDTEHTCFKFPLGRGMAVLVRRGNVRSLVVLQSFFGT